jgi:hypothetical protein
MPLILLTVSRTDIALRDRAARHGDVSALTWFRSLWSEYEGQEIACFLCDAVTGYPPYVIFLPDYADKTQAKMLAAPLCSTCAKIPRMKQLNRCFRVLRRMSGRKNLGFTFAGVTQHRF